MNFGRALRIARALRDLSQKDLAKRASLTPSFISLLEKNLRQPSAETQQRIATALEIPTYILALLAARESELKGVTTEQALAIGMELIKLVASQSPNLSLFPEEK